MRKTFKVVLLTVLMALACITAAFATATPAPTEAVDMDAAKAAFGDTMVTVKYGAKDITEIISLMEKTVRDQDVHNIIQGLKRSNTPTDFKLDGGMSCALTFKDGTEKTVIVSYKIVSPALEFAKTLGSITAVADQNRSKTTVLAYANSALELVAAKNTDYDNALGTPPAYTAPKFTWNASEYYAKGGLTYTFTQVYMDKTLTRSITVASVSSDAPDVYLDPDSGTVSTTRDLKYSIDRRTWSGCSENMTVPDKWQGQRIYFYRPASTYVDESSTTYLDIPYRADAPTTKPNLTATSHSITVTNVWDYDDPQFSLDGKQWRSTSKSTFIFEGLSANAKYTVYVREGGSRDQLASKTITASITTGKKLVTGVDVTSQKDGKMQTVTAVATVKPSISSKTLSGSLSTDDMSRFKAVVKEAYDNKYTVCADFFIEQSMEVNEGKEVNATKFTMPMSALSDIIKNADTSITVDTPIAEIFLDKSAVLALKGQGSGDTLTVNMQKVSSLSSGTRYEYLKECLNKGYAVFDISVKSGSNTASGIRYYLPYELSVKERLDTIEVVHVDEKGKQTKMDAVYNSAKRAMVFTTDKSGYFTIVQDRNTVPVMAFTDMRDHWAYSYVSYCTVNKLFNGVSADAFAPNMEISRSMIVTLLGRLEGIDEVLPGGATSFTDVKGDEWFAASVQWAYANGIIVKQGEQFGPEANMSREEIACTLANYLEYKRLLPATSRDAGYDDSKDISAWAMPAVNAVAELGVMTGVDGNKFKPNGTMTRAEMATILYRLNELV